jgi:hypothetical protein
VFILVFAADTVEMATSTKLVPMRSRPAKPSPLTPELMDFIDRAIVPALLKKYLAEIDLAETPAAVALSQRSTAVTRKVRP